MPFEDLPRNRKVVIDCLTIFKAIVGPREDGDALLMALFAVDEPRCGAVTTTAEFARARLIVDRHHDKRPQKFPAPHRDAAVKLFDEIEAGHWPGFLVEPHPTATSDADDHLVLLSAAATWEVGYMTTRQEALLRMARYRDVQLLKPNEVLEALPDVDDLGYQ